MRVLTRCGFALVCQFVRLFRAVATLPAIAAHLARDGRGMDAEVAGDLLLGVLFFQQGGNLVSLLAG